MSPFWAIDSRVVEALNRFAACNPTVDSIAVYLNDSTLWKGGIIVALFWWAWFRPDTAATRRREGLATGAFLGMLAIFLARTLAAFLPFRVRPLHDALLHLQVPHGMDPNTLVGWSAFPSDHATFFFCLAACLWYVSKPLGLIAIFQTLFVICLPRVYLGIHYPSDIVCGAFLGITVSALALNGWVRTAVGGRCLAWQRRHPQSFALLAFLISFEFTELFSTLRNAAGLSASLFHSLSIYAGR